MRKNYDKLYGISVEEYAKRHGVTVEELVEKVKTDIDILRENYNRYAKRNESLSEDELQAALEIRRAIEKKEAHLKRLCKWVGKEWCEKSFYDLFTGERLRRTKTIRGAMYELSGREGEGKKLIHYSKLKDPRFVDHKPSGEEMRRFREKTMIYHVEDGDRVLGINGDVYVVKKSVFGYGDLTVFRDDGSVAALCDYDGFIGNVRIVFPREVEKEAEELVRKIKDFAPSKEGDEFMFLSDVPWTGPTLKVTKVLEDKLEAEDESGEKLWIYKNGRMSAHENTKKTDDEDLSRLSGFIAVKKEFAKSLSDRERHLLFEKLALF